MAKNKYTDIDLSKYDGGFQGTDRTKAAEAQKTAAESAVANFGDFNYSRQNEYDNAMNAYLNRGPFQYSNQSAYDQAMNAMLNRDKFTYDLNGDALYQQYKDNYITQGKQAMMDTMGQAAAMTGGYGNSYAATVGNQTYQGYLQNLNNIVPELYQMAMDRYNSEGERLAQNFSVLSADRDTQRGEFNDETSRLQSNFNILSEDRNTERGEYDSALNLLLSNRTYYGDNYNNVYTQDYNAWSDNRTSDQTQYWNEYNAGYQAEQDAIANRLAQEQINATYAKAAADDVKVDYSALDNAVERIESGYESVPITRGNRGNTGNAGEGYKYNGRTYQSYESYVDAYLKDMYENGAINYGTLEALWNKYDIK